MVGVYLLNLLLNPTQQTIAKKRCVQFEKYCALKMKFKVDKFYDGNDGKRKLKEKYVFSYSYFPGLYGKICTIDLFVKQNMTFKLYLFFHEKNMAEFLKTSKVERIEYYQESKLPFEIREILSNILSSNFELKGSYHNSNNTFGILDRTLIGTTINHKNSSFSIDLSPDIINKELFKTESETDYLKLIEMTEKWLNHLTDSLMNIYTVE